MNKLIAICCSLLCMHSIAQGPWDSVPAAGTSGEKVLVKALTMVVNREGNKKIPLRRMDLALFDYP